MLYAELAAQGISTRIVVGFLPFAVLSVGLLMVSQIRYVHLVNRVFRGYRSFTRLVEMVFGVLVIGALLVVHTEGTLLGGFTLYALSGPILSLRARLLHRPAPQPLPQPQEPNP
jgi:phosphatidylserine synthase